MNSFASSIYAATKAYVPTVQLNISLITRKESKELSPDSKSRGDVSALATKAADISQKSDTTMLSTSSDNDSNINIGSYHLLLEENVVLRGEVHRLQRQRSVAESANSLCTKRNDSFVSVNHNHNNCGFSDDLRTSYDSDSGSEYTNDWESYSDGSGAAVASTGCTLIDDDKLPRLSDLNKQSIVKCNERDDEYEDDEEEDVRSAKSDRDSLNKSAYIRKLLNRMTDFEVEVGLLNDQLSKLADKEAAQGAAVRSLTEQVGQLEYDKAQMAAELLQIVPLQLKTNEMKAAIAAYRSSLADKESTIKDNASLKIQLSKLTGKLEASRAEVQLLAAGAAAFAELQQRSQKWESDQLEMQAAHGRLRDRADQVPPSFSPPDEPL